jgi:aspartate 1-decarboxylase
MLVKVLKSKIHRARVTACELQYEGSITIDEDLVEAAGLVPGEAVLVSNLNNGSRQETYVVTGPRGSGTVCLNGASARLANVGDTIIIMGFAYLAPDELKRHVPRKVVVDERNRIERGR